MILGFITIAMLQSIAVSAGAATITGLISLGFKKLMSKLDKDKKEKEEKK